MIDPVTFCSLWGGLRGRLSPAGTVLHPEHPSCPLLPGAVCLAAQAYVPHSLHGAGGTWGTLAAPCEAAGSTAVLAPLLTNELLPPRAARWGEKGAPASRSSLGVGEKVLLAGLCGSCPGRSPAELGSSSTSLDPSPAPCPTPTPGLGLDCSAIPGASPPAKGCKGQCRVPWAQGLSQVSAEGDGQVILHVHPRGMWIKLGMRGDWKGNSAFWQG